MPTIQRPALTFDLLIDPHGDGYRARVINGPVGEEQHEFAKQNRPVTIPEPTTVLLLSVGLAGLYIRKKAV